jgi:IS30 family transposase
MAKNSHLTLSDRIAIEIGLRERKSFSAIAEELGQHRTEKSVQKMPFSGKIGVWINK